MGIFKFFKFNKKTHTDYLGNEEKADILILWRIGLNNFNTSSTIPSYIKYKYGADGEFRIKYLLEKGYIKTGHFEKNLSLLTIPEIKQKLKLKKIPISGNKSELLLKLRANFSKDEISDVFSKYAYVLTKSGEEKLASGIEVVNEHNKEYEPTIFGYNEVLVHNNSQLKRMADGQYEYYKILRGAKCLRHEEFENSRFLLSKAIVGSSCPPFDKDCTCTIVPVIDLVNFEKRSEEIRKLKKYLASKT